MSEFDLTAEPRAERGKGDIRRMRGDGKVPAIVYGAGQDPTPIVLDHNELLKRLDVEGFYSRVLKLKLGRKAQNVVLKDIQRHPVKPKVLHVDFLRVRATEALRMRVPLHFLREDEAPGVRLHGGIITHLMTDVEIECLPGDLPEYIDVDVSQFEIGDSFRLADLKLPPKVALVDLLGFDSMDEDEQEAANQTVVSVKPPAIEEVEAPAEGEEAVAPEPEAPPADEEPQ